MTDIFSVWVPSGRCRWHFVTQQFSVVPWGRRYLFPMFKMRMFRGITGEDTAGQRDHRCAWSGTGDCWTAIPHFQVLCRDPYMAVPTSWLTSLSFMLSSVFHCSGLAAPSLALHQQLGASWQLPSLYLGSWVLLGGQVLQESLCVGEAGERAPCHLMPSPLELFLPSGSLWWASAVEIASSMSVPLFLPLQTKYNNRHLVDLLEELEVMYVRKVTVPGTW